MAAEEKRTITIKINGQEVAASVKLLEKELAKARVELKNSEIGSTKYNQAMGRIKELSPVLNKHNADLRNMSKSVGDVGQKAGGLKGMFQNMFSGLGGAATGNPLASLAGAIGPIGLLAGGAAALFGVFRGGLKDMREFETALSQLKVRTGITNEGIIELKEQAIELGKAYGEAPKDIIKAFGEAASARPELVKNTEALRDFTEQGLLLSKITGDDINTSITNLASIMNTNGIATSDTSDAVNILVGAAQKGAKEIPFLAQAMEKVGGSAASANVGLAEQAATIELLGEKYTSSAETAGTNVRNILITLQQEWAKNNEGPFNFQEALAQLAPEMNNITSLTNIFGKENVVAAQTLLQNRERLAELTTEISGFTGASDIAKEAQNNLDGQLDKVSARWEGYWAKMSGANGAMTALVGGFDIMVQKVEDFSAEVGLAFDLIFDKADTLQRLENERQKNAIVGRKNSAQQIVETKGLDEAKIKLAEMIAFQKTLSKESDRYRQNGEQMIVLQDAIIAKEADLALAKQKQNDEEAAALAQNEIERKKTADANKKIFESEAREREKALADERELIKLRNLGISGVQSKGFERGADFKGLAGAGDLIEDPLKSGVDLEAMKAAQFEAGLKSQLEMQIAHNAQIAEENRRAMTLENREKIAGAADVYMAMEGAAFSLISIGAQKRTNREIKALEDKKKKGLISEADYQKQLEALQKSAFQKKKKLDIAEALINGAVGITKTFAQLGWPAGIAGAAAIALGTAAQVASIAAQEYEEGGLVRGKSHADGGVPIVVEGDEFVVRKRSVNPATLPILKAINEGKMPVVNFAERSRTLTFERGGRVEGAMQGSSGDGFSTAIVSELRAMRNEMAGFEKTKRVVFVKEDADEFDERVVRVESIVRA